MRANLDDNHVAHSNCLTTFCISLIKIDISQHSFANVSNMQNPDSKCAVQNYPCALSLRLFF